MSKIIKYVNMQEAPMLIDSSFIVEETKNIAENASETKDSADDVIAKANEQAANIIAQAQITAEQYLSEARGQAETMKQQAHDEGLLQGHKDGQEEGFLQGQQEGQRQGREAGKAEMQQVIDEAVTKAQQMLEASEQEKKEMMFAAEREIVDIALAVARKIIAYEITENPMVVLPLVKAALQKVCDQEEVVIRVSVDDFDSVLMAKKDLQTMVGREHALKIIVDHTLESGNCIIDTSYGEVDARIDTQFEIIKKVLQGVA